jgi:hypothetical protein
LGLVGVWIWPLFLVVHGIAFFVVDFVFAALGVAALALATPKQKALVDAHLLRTIDIRLLP